MYSIITVFLSQHVLEVKKSQKKLDNENLWVGNIVRDVHVEIVLYLAWKVGTALI